MFTTTIKKIDAMADTKVKLALQDNRSATKLTNEVTLKGKVRLNVAHFAVLEKVDSEDATNNFTQICILTDEGDKYVTGSGAFIQRFLEIAEAVGDDTFSVECYQQQSKKNASAKYLMCALTA